MLHGPLVIFERRPRWAPELQRRFHHVGTEVRACSSRADVWNTAQNGASVVILVLDDAERDSLELLGRLSAMAGAPRTVVVGSPQTADLEWPLRELGVTGFVTGRTTSDQLVDLCHRLMTD